MMFFVPFFAAFFYYGLSYIARIGGKWPGCGINSPAPFGVPLINTALLLYSGLLCQFATLAVSKREFYHVI